MERNHGGQFARKLRKKQRTRDDPRIAKHSSIPARSFGGPIGRKRRMRDGSRRSAACLLGEKTGRSPKDKYVVAGPDSDESIWWEHQKPMTADEFSRLRRDLDLYLSGKNAITQDLTACADPDYRLNVRVVCELAWQALAIRHLLRADAENGQATSASDWTIMCCPGFSAAPGTAAGNSETVIALNFAERTVLICGTGYAGEIKKSVFTVLNYILPRKNVLPMHCAANHAPGDPDAAAFVLRVVRDGQDDTFRRPAAHSGRGRRARLVGRRHFQFRRRLLREDLESQWTRRT